MEPAYSTASSNVWAFYSSKLPAILAAIPLIWFSSSSSQYSPWKCLIQWTQPKSKSIRHWGKIQKSTRFSNDCTHSRFPVISALSIYQLYNLRFSIRRAVEELFSEAVDSKSQQNVRRNDFYDKLYSWNLWDDLMNLIIVRIICPYSCSCPISSYSRSCRNSWLRLRWPPIVWSKCGSLESSRSTHRFASKWVLPTPFHSSSVWRITALDYSSSPRRPLLDSNSYRFPRIILYPSTSWQLTNSSFVGPSNTPRNQIRNSDWKPSWSQLRHTSWWDSKIWPYSSIRFLNSLNPSYSYFNFNLLPSPNIDLSSSSDLSDYYHFLEFLSYRSWWLTESNLLSLCLWIHQE